MRQSAARADLEVQARPEKKICIKIHILIHISKNFTEFTFSWHLFAVLI